MTSDAGEARVSIAPILAVNFVGSLGFSIVLPFLVFLVTRWGGNGLIYGVMGATYSAFQLVGAPILGRWSDSYGRRKILILSQGGTLLAWLILLMAFFLPERTLLEIDGRILGKFAITVPLVVLFFARAADGLTGGNISVANAYLADITTEEERSKNFGRMAMSSNLGFIIGPALAGLLGATALGEMLPVLAALLISVAALLMIFFRLPESRPCVLAGDPCQPSLHKVLSPDQKECFEIKKVAGVSVREVFRLRCVPSLLGVYFLVMLGFNFFYASFPVHAARGLAWSVVGTGVFFAVLSALMALVQGPILARLSRSWSDGTLIGVGSLALAACFPFFTSQRTGLIYVGAALMALGNGVMWPSLLAMLSKAAGTDYQGVVQGFAGSSGAVASIIGLLAGGALYGLLDARVFFLSAMAMLAVFLLSLRVMSSRIRVRDA
jgi:MFS family permease